MTGSMDEYRAIYKCRLCGETYESGVTITSRQKIVGTVAFLNYRDNSRISPTDALGITRTTPHACKDGSIGLSDFCGFRIAEKSDDTFETEEGDVF